MQAEITDTKIVFPKNVGLDWRWTWSVCNLSQNL